MRERTSLTPWTPSPQQQRAAEYLAAGYSQNRTAELIGSQQRTVWQWCQREDFAAHVAFVRQRLVEAQRPLYDNSVSIAQVIYTRALTGEAVDDRDLALAIKLLEQTLWRTARPRAAIDEGRGGNGTG